MVSMATMVGMETRRLINWSAYAREDGLPTNLTRLIGILPGEGIGSEVIECALHVLDAVSGVADTKFELVYGGDIGRQSEKSGQEALPQDVITFCAEVFAKGGCILNGPGGGRYVYDLRRVFDLYCKLSPIRSFDELADTCRLKADHVKGVDILMVRENASGLYQGEWSSGHCEKKGRVAEHRFSYSEAQVNRILEPAAQIARTRKGLMTVVFKESGIPAISELWRDCARATAERVGVKFAMLDIDLMVYRLIQHAQDFDVIVAPNMFGDVLSDLGGVLMGSRGLTFAGSYSGKGEAVYQTNHGAAYELAGTNTANPVGQIFSLAMLLRESMGMAREADLIERAVAKVCSAGWRTADMMSANCRLTGTKEMSELIAQTVSDLASEQV